MGGREVGIHCVVCPGAGFVRIGSHSGWYGRLGLVFWVIWALLCEDWPTQ